MFGGAKPTFGTTAATTGFSTFNTAANASPFGASAFGKPATSAFGAAPTFGTQQTTPSLFGAAAGQQQTTGLFGGASTSSAFGATTTAQPGFGSFTQQQPQQNTSIFNAAQPAANTTSLFGQTGTSAFGSAVKPAGLVGFGQTSAQPSTLFGQQPTQTSTSGFGTFGQAAPTTTNVFGSTAGSAFGQPAGGAVAGANPGTSIAKYQPIMGTDTLMKGGQPNTVNTKQHCITAMKEYESKSLEELRMEDYLGNRKGPQAGAPTTGGFFGSAAQPTTNTGLFGQTTQQQTNTLFGQPQAGATENKGLFGSNAFGQNQQSAFGNTATQQNSFGMKPFGATGTTAFGTAAADSANPFGAKPAFGTTGTPNLFGQTTATSTAPAFGQTTSGFGGFGSTAGATQQPSLFGNTTQDPNKPTFGLGAQSTANTGFGGFGTTATSTAGSTLFGAKPNTGFGATPGFGQTSQPNTGFSNFSLNNTNTGTGLFNSSLNKPATSGFGSFGTQNTTGGQLNFNAGNTGSTLFGNTAAKPGGLFGSNFNTQPNNTSVGTGLFGSNANTTSLWGGGGMAGNTLMGGNTTQNTLGGTPQQQQQVPIHQQILSKVTSPYGDNPIFKDLKRSDETDAKRATNPEAQKAIIDATTNNFKVNAKSSPSVIKVKPLGSALTKKSLFEGLEESDATVESFTLKPNAKRLIIKQKSNTSLAGGTGSQTGTPNTSLVNTSLAENNSSGGVRLNNSARNESFIGEIPTDGPTSGANTPAAAGSNKDNETSRRESWLHPNNLEKVRQHNINTGAENASPLNSTLTELVPRKPLETYRGPATGAARHSVSTIPENPFEDQSGSISRRETVTFADSANDSLFANRSFTAEEQRSGTEEPHIEYDEHPTGITLTRIGYYTVPSLDELKSYLAEDGSCVVPNFTVGRKGYGNVYFPKEMDVAGLNLDEIVHFRNKEVTIYPDDDNKPPVGSGLNRDAQVTLDNVWPLDKTKHEPIKDPERLLEMDWEGKLRRVCDKNETRFVEYRPETGSWVFRVKHFSKYGLNDSDEEDDTLPADAKKAKMMLEAKAKAMAADSGAVGGLINIADKVASLRNAQMLSEAGGLADDPKAYNVPDAGIYPMDESAEFMLMDKTQYLQSNLINGNALYEHSKVVTSPTAALAKEAGTDSHKLQLMKASFFADDDNKSVASELEHDYNRNIGVGLFGIRREDIRPASRLSSMASSHMDHVMNFATSPKMPSTASLLSGYHGAATDTSSSPIESDDTVNVATKKLAPFIVRPKVALIKPMAVDLPYNTSIGYRLRTTYAADLGLYNSRLFKTSFGPANTLIVPNTRNNLKGEMRPDELHMASARVFSLRGKNDYSALLMQKIQISGNQHYPHFNESIVEHLEIELHNSLLQTVEDSECPCIKSNAGTDLIVKHLDEAIKKINLGELEEYAVSVWSLCLALWGEHAELEGYDDASSHFVVMCRRNLLSEWLENTLTDKDLLVKKVTKNGYLEHLLELLMCHKVTEACELAFKYDDANLALLLSQLSSGPIVRQLMEDQLAAWHKNGADEFIQVERLKLFMFVCGVPLMNSAQGPINVLEDQPWIKVLALQLWYLCSPTASITDALLAYNRSFEASEFSALPPRPAYENFITENTPNSRQNFYDMRYHLLQLYSKRSHPLESLLNPATHTTDPMDYRLSWLLLQTLEALGYQHCSALSECQLHVGFASQLENYGLWEWAIFVLLHIKDRNQREISVQNILYRYVSASKDIALNDKERFVIQNLGVPEKWIDYAKAVKAGSLGNYHMQAKYLLKAKQYNLAHKIIFEHIAPEAVINDNQEYLHGLLSQFESGDLQTNIKVPNWSNQGQIFLDFFDITRKFENMKNLQNSADIETRWENLKPQLADLCSRINLLPCPTASHRLCQSEIAQNLAVLIRGVVLVCPDLNPCLIIQFALERLPLPQEFSKHELNHLLEALVQNLSKTHTITPSEAMAIN